MKKLLLCILVLMFISGCSNDAAKNDESVANIVQANNVNVLDSSFAKVFIDIYRYDDIHYSLYNDTVSSQECGYDEDNHVTYMLVKDRNYTYGYGPEERYYTTINLTGEYDRYHDVYTINWDALDINNIEMTGSNMLVNMKVKDENKTEYLKNYGYTADDIDHIDVMLFINKDSYALQYRSEMAVKADGSDVTLFECDYHYDEENPQKEYREQLDEHHNKADNYQLISVIMDPDTAVEQRSTYKSPLDDDIELIMPEGYKIDETRSVTDDKGNITYYLVNDANKDKIINKDEKESKPVNDKTASDDASGFVLLSEAVPDAILEIRYYSTYNFVGDRIDGYEQPVALLTKEAAEALKKVSDELVTKGYRLKIYDAYRPSVAVDHFVRWAKDIDDTRMKEYFYPELDKAVLFEQGYIAEKSGHSRGSTVDLTLFDMKSEKEADMGGTFDYFGELSHPDYKDITEQQYANRMLLRETMMKYGFKPLVEEWWHFTLENEPYPDTYFSFPVSEDSIKNRQNNDR